MSIPVEVEALSETVAQYGPEAFLRAFAEDAACGSDCLRPEVPGTGSVEP